MNVHSRFETELQVRPDDIDMFQHVHSSRYMDYVLAARVDQMGRCYGMAWEEYIKRGLGWFLFSTRMEFLRPLMMGDRFIVRTWIEDIPGPDTARVCFEIDRLPARKRCFQGEASYKLVQLSTGRAVAIPEDIRARFEI